MLNFLKDQNNNQVSWYEGMDHCEDEDEDEEEDSDEDDGAEHPSPCDCSKMRCILIKATLERYKAEEELKKE